MTSEGGLAWGFDPEVVLLSHLPEEARVRWLEDDRRIRELEEERAVLLEGLAFLEDVRQLMGWNSTGLPTSTPPTLTASQIHVELNDLQCSTAGPPPPGGLVDVGQPLQRKPAMTTRSEWWAEDTERWRKSLDWLNAETQADYLRHLRKVPDWLARLGFETPSNAHAFTAEMVMAISWDRDRSGSAREKALIVLHQYLGWKAVPLATNRRLWKEAKAIDTTPDPSRRHRLPVVDVVKLTRTAQSRERWAILVALALWMGLRQGEIRHLRVGDIDFGTRRVHVRYGKGNKARHLKLSSVAEGLLEPLRRLEDPYEIVYPFGRTTLARDLWRACDAAGIRRYAPHDLRATCVKMAKAAGASPLGRQLLLGHARFEQTRAYEGEDDLELEDAVDKLSEFGERILEGE